LDLGLYPVWRFEDVQPYSVLNFPNKYLLLQGAQEILRRLPHEYISAKKLPQVAKNGSKKPLPKGEALGDVNDIISATKRIYICVITRDDHLRRMDGRDNGKFSIADYEAHPDHYESSFATEVLNCETPTTPPLFIALRYLICILYFVVFLPCICGSESKYLGVATVRRQRRNIPCAAHYRLLPISV
jgi:hypothetical protein